MRVSDILRAKNLTPLTVNPDTLLSQCVITMADEDLGSFVVVDGCTVVGLLTFREVIHVLAKRQKDDGSWANETDKWMEGNPVLVSGYALMTLAYTKPKE